MSRILFGTPEYRVNIPVELASLAALLDYLGLTNAEMRKIRFYRDSMYHNFRMQNKNKLRIINAPDRRLKYIQRKLTSIISKLYRIRRPVHGFVNGKSIKSNAAAHIRKRFVLNIDLQDFFPSITEARIVGLMETLGICSDVAKFIGRISCYQECLPQGAPSSPLLSNMICFRLDKDLLVFSKNNRCIYTRYADDITFSSYQPMTGFFEGIVPTAGHFAIENLSSSFRNIIINNGFAINPSKVHFADRNSRRMVTGLKVNEFLNLDRRYVRNIRAKLFSIEQLGLEKAQEKFQTHSGKDSKIGAHLKGKIAWLGHIRGQSDPVFRALAVRFNEVFPDHYIKVIPTELEVRDRSVWVLDNDKTIEQGSAFFLSGIGLVTAAHCVKNANSVEIYHPSKRSNKFEVNVDVFDENYDLAILRHSIPETEFFELPRASNPVYVGDNSTALGYPGFGPGDGLNVRSGNVTSLPTKHTVKLIEVSQKLVQGMSGGPLLNNKNEVIGVAHKGGPEEGRDFAVHIDMLVKWLSNLKRC